MRWKRAILLGAAALVAGAVVNVGVAWGIAIWPPRESFGPADPKLHPPRYPMPVPSDWPKCELMMTGQGWGFDTVVAGGWIGADQGSYVQCKSLSSGWPLRSLVSAFGFGGNSKSIIFVLPDSVWSGISLEGRPRYEGGRALPVVPVWPGFALNTLVYAAAVSAPFWCVGAVKRWRRRAKGQCERCG